MALLGFVLALVITGALCAIHHITTERKVRAGETAKAIANLHTVYRAEKRLYLAEREAA